MPNYMLVSKWEPGAIRVFLPSGATMWAVRVIEVHVRK